jgi:hypothetical protein
VQFFGGNCKFLELFGSVAESFWKFLRTSSRHNKPFPFGGGRLGLSHYAGTEKAA